MKKNGLWNHVFCRRTAEVSTRTESAVGFANECGCRYLDILIRLGIGHVQPHIGYKMFRKGGKMIPHISNEWQINAPFSSYWSNWENQSAIIVQMKGCIQCVRNDCMYATSPELSSTNRNRHWGKLSYFTALLNVLHRGALKTWGRPLP